MKINENQLRQIIREAISELSLSTQYKAQKVSDDIAMKASGLINSDGELYPDTRFSEVESLLEIAANKGWYHDDERGSGKRLVDLYNEFMNFKKKLGMEILRLERRGDNIENMFTDNKDKIAMSIAKKWGVYDEVANIQSRYSNSFADKLSTYCFNLPDDDFKALYNTHRGEYTPDENEFLDNWL